MKEQLNLKSVRIEFKKVKVQLNLKSVRNGFEKVKVQQNLKSELDCNGLLCTGESPGTTDWDPLARAISPLPSTSRTPKNHQKSIFLPGWHDLLSKSRNWGELKPINKILTVVKVIFWRAILWLTSFGK